MSEGERQPEEGDSVDYGSHWFFNAREGARERTEERTRKVRDSAIRRFGVSRRIERRPRAHVDDEDAALADWASLEVIGLEPAAAGEVLSAPEILWCDDSTLVASPGSVERQPVAWRPAENGHGVGRTVATIVGVVATGLIILHAVRRRPPGVADEADAA